MVVMTQGIADKLIDIYENALKEMPSDFEEANDFCIKNYLDLGICYLANNSIEVELYHCDFINSFKDRKAYVCNPAIFCQSIDEIKASIAFRINILKSFK